MGVDVTVEYLILEYAKEVYKQGENSISDENYDLAFKFFKQSFYSSLRYILDTDDSLSLTDLYDKSCLLGISLNTAKVRAFISLVSDLSTLPLDDILYLKEIAFSYLNFAKKLNAIQPKLETFV